MSIESTLAFGSPKHRQILDMVLQRRVASQRKMKEYYQKWNDADDAFIAYQPTSEVDAQRKSDRRTTGKHDYVTITVPYTFATIMTAHTYWASVFLSRAPIYQLQGRHGETQDSVEAFEAVLDYQKTVGEHAVPLYNWGFDMHKYGLGVIGSYWDERSATISRMVDAPVTIMGVPILNKTKKVMQTVTVPTYAGNALYNVRPYDWFPDPRVAITSFQRGEFCGRDTQMAWHEILEGQQRGDYFNVNQLAARMSATNSSMFDTEDGSNNVNLPDKPGQVGVSEQVPGPGFANIHEMGIRIIPSVLGLGPSNKTEIWVFTIANGSVIIGAKPQGLYHDRFAFDIQEFGFGAHSFMKMSLTEVMDPLNETISWLLNSHFYNVRKALNDVRVVDPSRIVMKDLISPIERGIVRLKPEAYGTDTRTAVTQLAVPDMTQSHLRDIGVMEQMIQRITGVVDELMGISGGPDRESATGVRTRTGSAVSRLRTIAEYNSALGFSPLIAKLVSNTQQLMSMEQKFRVAGLDNMANAQRFMDVSPQNIAGFYDFVPVDGTLPIDRLAQANFWKELTMQLAQSPMLASQFDLVSMVQHIMRLQGEKNINRFRLQVMPPGQLQQGVQAGNLVPINGGKSGGGSQPAKAAGGSSGATL